MGRKPMRGICFYMNCTGVEGKLAKEKKLQHKKNSPTNNQLFFIKDQSRREAKQRAGEGRSLREGGRQRRKLRDRNVGARAGVHRWRPEPGPCWLSRGRRERVNTAAIPAP